MPGSHRLTDACRARGRGTNIDASVTLALIWITCVTVAASTRCSARSEWRQTCRYSFAPSKCVNERTNLPGLCCTAKTRNLRHRARTLALICVWFYDFDEIRFTHDSCQASERAVSVRSATSCNSHPLTRATGTSPSRATLCDLWLSFKQLITANKHVPSANNTRLEQGTN